MARKKKNGFSREFLSLQKKRINEKLKKYNDPDRIKQELENGDVSDYTKYKQAIIVPILRETLHKIRTGEYGYCEKCHEKIEPARLEIVPEAKNCMKCLKLKANNS